MKAFDARCHACGDVHIVWVWWGHGEGDEIGHAHTECATACGEYATHTLVSSLDGLSNHDKWGPDSGAAEG